MVWLILTAIVLGVTALGAGGFGLFQWGKNRQQQSTIDKLTTMLSLSAGAGNIWTSITGMVIPILVIGAIVILGFILLKRYKRR